MKRFAEKLTEPIFLHQWPQIECPYCNVGALPLEEDRVVLNRDPYFNTTEFDVNDGEPESIVGTFAAQTICTAINCKGTTLVYGDFTVHEVSSFSNDRQFETKYSVRGFYPPIDVAETAGVVPDAIKAELSRVGSLVWNDPRAAATALRASIEILLDEQDIPRLSTNKNHSPLYLSTRIDNFHEAHPEVDVKDLLDAVRIVGNSNTHDSSVTTAGDLLRTLEIVETALDHLYPAPTPSKYANSNIEAKRIIAEEQQRKGRE